MHSSRAQTTAKRLPTCIHGDPPPPNTPNTLVIISLPSPPALGIVWFGVGFTQKKKKTHTSRTSEKQKKDERTTSARGINHAKPPRNMTKTRPPSAKTIAVARAIWRAGDVHTTGPRTFFGVRARSFPARTSSLGLCSWDASNPALDYYPRLGALALLLASSIRPSDVA